MGRSMGSMWLRGWGGRRGRRFGGVGRCVWGWVGNYRQYYMGCVYGTAWVDTALVVRMDNYE